MSQDYVLQEIFNRLKEKLDQKCIEHDLYDLYYDIKTITEFLLEAREQIDKLEREIGHD